VSDSVHERRTRDAQARLRERGDAGLVLFPSQNLRYLSGFSEEPRERQFMLLVPSEGDPAFLAPELSARQVREASWVPTVRAWADEDDPLTALAEVAADCGMTSGRLLVDDTMWATFTQDLRATLPDATFGLASSVLAPLRVRKDEAELDAMRAAARAADAVVADLREWGADVVGLTEADLAARVEDALERHGGRGVAFETIVGSGPNGAKPHHTHGDREIRAGDPVVLDFGTRVDGYPSDLTRTLVFGDGAPERLPEVHETVLAAGRAAVDAVAPGVACETVDAAAREVVADAGHGEAFIHRTGHGVGLDVHEAPYIVDGNDRELEPGMVFSVEPGVYLEGAFGVRIEDLVVVTADGCERLNHADRDWRTD
jgi:Xaa-Pro aminopeptidase